MAVRFGGVSQGAGGGTTIALKTNNVANASQSILNLVNGSNITITDGGGGAISIAASASSTTLTTLGAATGSVTLASGNNTGIVWNWANTADSTVAFTLGETSAATNGTSTSGIPNQVLLKLITVAASTQSPLSVYSRASHVFSVSPTAAQILATNGSSTIPTYAFAAAINTGMSYTGSALQFSVAGTILVQASSSQWNMSQQLNVVPGTIASPGLSTTADNTTGLVMNNTGPGSIAFSIVGVEHSRLLGTANAMQMIFKNCTFANLATPADGAFAYCSDCDPPTLVDSTCTSAGAKTGSFAARVNGAWKCFT